VTLLGGGRRLGISRRVPGQWSLLRRLGGERDHPRYGERCNSPPSRFMTPYVCPAVAFVGGGEGTSSGCACQRPDRTDTIHYFRHRYGPILICTILRLSSPSVFLSKTKVNISSFHHCLTPIPTAFSAPGILMSSVPMIYVCGPAVIDS
jgi:hypothetical protein